MLILYSLVHISMSQCASFSWTTSVCLRGYVNENFPLTNNVTLVAEPKRNIPEDCHIFYSHTLKMMSRVDLSVYCLAMGWTTGRSRFDPQQRRKDFSSSLCVHTGSGAHPASCTMGTGGPFRWGKERPGRDIDHSPPSSVEVENEELYLLSPQAPKWRVVGQL
jgi:hypothetical protein